MYYTLEEDVFIVNGALRSCIYDFKNSKLYSINGLLASKINEINYGQLQENEIEDENIELRNILDVLLEQNIIKVCKKPTIHRIEDIIEPDSMCQFAWIEITNKCNLRCVHCYNESNVKCENVMSIEKYKFVVNQLVEMGVPRIQIIGGEPFFDIAILTEMLNYVVGKFEFIEIFTNGTLVTDSLLSFVKQNDIHIALSVYSYDEEMHDKVTGVSGSWLWTNSTIEKLKENGIQYRVCNVRMKDIDIGKKNSDLYTLSEDKDIVRMSGSADFTLLSDELIKRKLITKESFQSPITKMFCKRLISGHNCFQDKIYISASLEVFPCVMERRVKHCDINNGKKIVLDDNIKYLTKDKINECSSCEYKYACFDCRPNAISEKIYEKPWYCTYQPELGKWENVNEFMCKLKNNCSNNCKDISGEIYG